MPTERCQWAVVAIGFSHLMLQRLFAVDPSATSLRDPRDWPAIASALALSAGIWTNDNDFLGTGVATWTTETLQQWLQRHAAP